MVLRYRESPSCYTGGKRLCIGSDNVGRAHGPPARASVCRPTWCGPPQIRDRGAQGVGLLSEKSQRAVTVAAKQAAHRSGQMTMVDAKHLAVLRCSLADRADATLVRKHGIVLLRRYSVEELEPSPALICRIWRGSLLARRRIGKPLAAPTLSDLFLVGLPVGVRGREQPLSERGIGPPSVTPALRDLFLMGLLVGTRGRNPSSSVFRIVRVSFACPFAMRTHVSRTRKLRQPAARTRARAKAGRRGARNERHAGPTCLSFVWLRNDACAANGDRAQDFGRCRGAEGAPGISRIRTQLWLVPETYPLYVT